MTSGLAIHASAAAVTANGAANATSLTELVIGLGALVAAYVVPLVLTRQKRGDDRDSEVRTAWAELSETLQEERRQLQEELRHQRDDFAAQMRTQQEDFARQMGAARARITELESEVATLQRLLRAGSP